MATLVTPSAKSHERVTGRWVRDIQAESKRDWIVYYAKQVIGTPVPFVFTAFICSIFVSRAAVEITGWATAVLALAYIVTDRASRHREFEFFRAGSDLTLIGFVAAAIAGFYLAPEPIDPLSSLGTLRWVGLFYLLTWCWKLFPGLNRMYHVLFGAAGLTAVYAVVQHFTGQDFIRQELLTYAPLKEHAFYVVTGFYRHPEILGTVFATLLPIPAAAFMLADRRDGFWMNVLTLALVVLLGLGILWTYKPGLWIAAAAGLFISMVLQPKRQLALLVVIGAILAGLGYGAYGSPDRLGEQIAAADRVRAENQRAQINVQVKIWEKSPWVGAGAEGSEALRKTESLDGNVYFQLLARHGAVGLAFYLLFSLGFLLGVYRVWREIPRTHFWHRVLASGGIAGLAAFHVSGLYWATLTDSHAVCLFVFVMSSLGYLCAHYDNGIVPDDHAL